MHKVLDPCSIIRVQSWDIGAAVPSQAEELLGLQWPKSSGALACGRVDILCIGGVEWLVLAYERNAVPVMESLHIAFAHSSYRATDLSAAFARIEVKGVQARALLAKGCSLDFHPSFFPRDFCARTRLAGMPVVVRCKGPAEFECIVALSYREYLFSWLTDATIEYSANLPQA